MTSAFTTRVLTPQQIEEFITRGWTKVEKAFPRHLAGECQDFLWEQLAVRGVMKDDRSTWRKPLEHIAESYNTPPFDACATAKLADAISDLVGAGRWINEKEVGWWGWWPINFAVGADQVWDVPADEWHIDSPDWGTYTTAPDQGLLVICIFSEIEPRGGGTLICEGSHQVVLRFLENSPGMTQNETNEALRSLPRYLQALCGRDGSANTPGTDTSNARGADATQFQRHHENLTTSRIEQFMQQTFVDDEGTELRVVEVTGSPGDVVLAHPFMFHSPSFNHSGSPRFMCNRKAPLFEPLQLERESGEYSPLEECARRTLRSKVNS